MTLTFLEQVGPRVARRLLTSGGLTDRDRAPYVTTCVQGVNAPVDARALAERFRAVNLSANTFARVINAPDLRAMDPYPGGAAPVLGDTDWVRLQTLCGA